MLEGRTLIPVFCKIKQEVKTAILILHAKHAEVAVVRVLVERRGE